MNKLIIGGALAVVALVSAGAYWYAPAERVAEQPAERFVEQEAGFEEVGDVIVEEVLPPRPADLPPMQGRIRWSAYWEPFTPEEARYYGARVREPGPARVGLQVGHYKNNEVPEELAGLERNGGGAQGGGYSEVDVVYDIAVLVKDMLEAEGVIVDLLPATIPPDYEADAFVSIHADGSQSSTVDGFKISGPRRDFSGKGEALVSALYESYERETGLPIDANVSRRMSGYYAFNWRRYEHAVHPMTPAVIVETGFLTSPNDRQILVGAPARSARGIAEGILFFLAESEISN